MHFYISEASQPLFQTWKYLPHSPQNPSFLHENEGIYLCVYKALFLHVENRITVWKNAIIHLNLHLFKKFNLRGKKSLRYFSPFLWRLPFEGWVNTKMLPFVWGFFFFFFFDICVYHKSPYILLWSYAFCCFLLLLSPSTLARF